MEVHYFPDFGYQQSRAFLFTERVEFIFNFNNINHCVSTAQKIINFNVSLKKSVLQTWPYTSGTRAAEFMRIVLEFMGKSGPGNLCA